MRLVTGLGIFSRNAVTRPSSSSGTQPNGARVLHLGEIERDVRVVLGMQVELRPDVVARQHVTVEDQDWLVWAAPQLVGDVADRATSAERNVLSDVLDLKPQPRAIAEPLREDLGLDRTSPTPRGPTPAARAWAS